LWGRRCVLGAGALSIIGLTAYSAILAKEAVHIPALVDVREAPLPDAAEDPEPDSFRTLLARTPAAEAVTDNSAAIEAVAFTPEPAPVETPAIEAPAPETPVVGEKPAKVWPADTRWFDGRPIRPIRTMTMVVTGYSPDSRSCGDSDDGITATLHSVETNGHALVAADPRVLPYGSMVSVPGYDTGMIVPVLDCGGAIKGKRLDLLFPTHEQARAWGRKTVKVTIWGFADGGAAPNPRKVR
jgi:3D (Asp-Asp-Asp) domain-containing protein